MRAPEYLDKIIQRGLLKLGREVIIEVFGEPSDPRHTFPAYVRKPSGALDPLRLTRRDAERLADALDRKGDRTTRLAARFLRTYVIPEARMASRVAGRHMAGLLKAPPELVKAVTEWAQEVFASEVYRRAERLRDRAAAKVEELRESVTRLEEDVALPRSERSERWGNPSRSLVKTKELLASYEDHLKRAEIMLGVSKSWKRAHSSVLDKYGGPVSATFDITDYLDGWSYRHLWDRLDSSERKVLRDGPLAPITVMHTFGSNKAEASWNPRTRTLTFYGFPEAMTFNKISEVAERYREIPTSARHELQHVTQQAIGAMTGSGWGGLPKRRLRRPESIEEQVFQYNRSGEVLDYVDSDVEYQTKLTDAVESWDRSFEPTVQRWLSQTGLSDRDQREFMKFYVRVYVGASVDPQRDFSRLLSRLPEYEDPWDQPKGHQSAFFRSLKRADSAKWRNAVGTFYKEIARTTRLAGDREMSNQHPPLYRWSDGSGGTEDDYGVHLDKMVWDEDYEEYELDDAGSRYFYIEGGEWKPSDPHRVRTSPKAENDWVIDDVMSRWEDKEGPKFTQAAVEERLYDLGFSLSGASNVSESTYFHMRGGEAYWTDKDGDEYEARVRVARHEPVHPSSFGAFNILIGLGGSDGRYGRQFYLDGLADESDIRKACKAALDWVREKERESASSSRVALAWLKQSKNLPKNVERYVQEGKDQGLDEGEAWAVAWSRYCKWKEPGSPHCKKDSPGDYLQNQGKKQASNMPSTRTRSAARPIPLDKNYLRTVAKRVVAETFKTLAKEHKGKTNAKQYKRLKSYRPVGLHFEVSVPLAVDRVVKRWEGIKPPDKPIRVPLWVTTTKGQPSGRNKIVAGGTWLRTWSTSQQYDFVTIKLYDHLSTNALENGPFEAEVFDALIHETTHLVDLYTRLQQGSAGFDEGHTELVDSAAYANDPKEVRAFMQQIADQVVQDIEGGSPSVAVSLYSNRLWQRLRKNLTDRNRNLILKGVYTAVQDSGLDPGSNQGTFKGLGQPDLDLERWLNAL